jgi:hypothetical protein
MKANPDKFQAIAIGSQTSNESISFNLDGNKIDCEKEVKLLGVTIDCQLKCNAHISNICKKASRLNFFYSKFYKLQLPLFYGV